MLQCPLRGRFGLPFVILFMAGLAVPAQEPAPQAPSINWGELRNPVLRYPDRSIKDFAMAEHQGLFHFFFSSFHASGGQVRSHLSKVTTTDFLHFSDPVELFDATDDGWIGYCSPDLFRDGDCYCLTFNSWGDLEDRPNQLFCCTSKDLERWSDIHPLAPELTDQRAIDAAAVRSDERIFLIWKEGQIPKLAVSDAIDGNFRIIGYPQFMTRDGSDHNRYENYHFERIDDQWRLLVTSMADDHQPYLFTMAGNPAEELNWLYWKDGVRIDLPRGDYNSESRANGAVLFDRRHLDGYLYLLFAGSPLTHRGEFLGRGWNALCLARSSDLQSWEAAAPRQGDSPTDATPLPSSAP